MSSGDALYSSDQDLKLSLVASYSPSDTFNDDVKLEDNCPLWGANVSLNLFEEGKSKGRRKLTLRSLKLILLRLATKIRFE